MDRVLIKALHCGAHPSDLSGGEASSSSWKIGLPSLREAARSALAFSRVAIASLAASFFSLWSSAEASLIALVMTPMKRFSRRKLLKSTKLEK